MRKRQKETLQPADQRSHPKLHTLLRSDYSYSGTPRSSHLRPAPAAHRQINHRIPLHTPIRRAIKPRPNDARAMRHAIRTIHPAVNPIHAINPILLIPPHPTTPPPLRANISRNADPNPERPIPGPSAPAPARARADREVVPAEGEPGADDADQAAGNDVEAEVAEVGEAGAGDVDGGCEGDEGNYEGPDGGSGRLVADGDYWGGGGVGAFVRGERAVVLCVGGQGETLFFLEGCVGFFLRVGARWEEGDCDGEFGAEEEG